MHESGLHRWQRIPPTETKGRVHTSAITVAVIIQSENKNIVINHKELDITTTRGTGKGGQHKNTTDSCVLVKHKPTGIEVRRDGRCQHKNKKEAINEITIRIKEYYNSIKKDKLDSNRKEQIGDGSRSDRIRTYNVKSNRVIDHRTNKKVSLAQIYKGKLELLM